MREERKEWEEEERRGVDRRWEGGGQGKVGVDAGRGIGRREGREDFLKINFPRKGGGGGWAIPRQPGKLNAARM